MLVRLPLPRLIAPAPVVCRGYPGGVLWITTQWFWFVFDGRLFGIPPGFVLDFYSIPRLMWGWRPSRIGVGDEAALIHDFLCRFWLLLGITRKQADRAFLEAMVVYDVSRASTKYRAVRLFGWAVCGGGAGRPGGTARRAMRDNGDDWRAYAREVAALPVVMMDGR